MALGNPKLSQRINYQRQQERLLYEYRQEKQTMKLKGMADELKSRLAVQTSLNKLKKMG